MSLPPKIHGVFKSKAPNCTFQKLSARIPVAHQHITHRTNSKPSSPCTTTRAQLPSPSPNQKPSLSSLTQPWVTSPLPQGDARYDVGCRRELSQQPCAQPSHPRSCRMHCQSRLALPVSWTGHDCHSNSMNLPIALPYCCVIYVAFGRGAYIAYYWNYDDMRKFKPELGAKLAP